MTRNDYDGGTLPPTTEATLTTAKRRSACTLITPDTPVRLRSDEIFVWWQEGGLPGYAIESSPGRDTQIDGWPARVGVEKMPARGGEVTCKRMAAERAVTATITEPQAGSWIFVTACLRGPFFGANETAVHQMLETVHFAG